ncbi:MAG TPA: redoxin domain-containing protein [candidate division Zixibacteria bacterium]|nr:redoxin domain-containing protein [candidate division Zixibacteria bacterium]
MENRVKVGDGFRDFSLEDQNETVFTLSKFKGKKVLLSFHPLAWTSVCSEQMKSLEKNKEAFDSLNTTAVGVSCDTVPSKRAWAKSLGIENTRLLSDFWPHGKVAETYCIFRSKYGTSERANIIIDENQKVTFVKVYPVGQLPDIKEIIEALKKLR